MAQGASKREYPDNERTVYVRFPCQNSEIDERVLKRLFGQFGGFTKLVMKPDQNFAFVVYDSPEQTLFICEILNGIQFMNGTLVVKPRDRTRNADIFQQSPYSRPARQQTVFYDQLDQVPFEKFDPNLLLSSKEDLGRQNN